MATLKVCTTKTHWVLGVKSLVEIGCFTVSAHINGAANQEDVYAAAFEAGLLEGHSLITQAEFENIEHAPQGVALLVEREAKYEDVPQLWLIPRRSAFLMSDSGGTIDRI